MFQNFSGIYSSFDPINLCCTSLAADSFDLAGYNGGNRKVITGKCIC